MYLKSPSGLYESVVLICLQAVIRGQQQSRWLRSFLSAKRRRVVNIYLEDDQQLDQVYWYLNELYAKAVAKSPCLAEVKSMESVPFVLDVLLPEAIIYAIAGVDNVSVKKAEEKYLKGRCISNRERQEFDLMIEQQIRRKSQLQNTGLELFSDSCWDWGTNVYFFLYLFFYFQLCNNDVEPW